MKKDTTEQTEMTAEQKRILNDFMLNISCLNPLRKYANKVNIFDVLKTSKHEIRHSNVLSWLLNPSENHGLGDNFLRAFLCKVLKISSEAFEVEKWVFQDLFKAQVITEWKENNKRLDILVLFENNNKLIAIENKLFSGEHKIDGKYQTAYYKEKLNEQYAGYEKMLVFLTPFGTEPQDDKWISLTYENIRDILLELMQEYDEKLQPTVKLILQNYIEIIEGEIMENNNELIRICTEIYNNNKDALNLIFDNRLDETAPVANFLKEVLEDLSKEDNNIIYDDSFHSGKTYVRFATKYMDQLLGKSKSLNAAWHNNQRHLYEIWVRELKANNTENLSIFFTLTCDNFDDKKEELTGKYLKICEALGTKKQKLPTQTTSINRKGELKNIFEYVNNNDKDTVKKIIKNYVTELESKVKKLNLPNAAL